jgi:hypothetical protein
LASGLIWPFMTSKSLVVTKSLVNTMYSVCSDRGILVPRGIWPSERSCNMLHSGFFFLVPPWALIILGDTIRVACLYHWYVERRVHPRKIFLRDALFNGSRSAWSIISRQERLAALGQWSSAVYRSWSYVLIQVCVHWCTIHFVHITLHIVVNAVALPDSFNLVVGDCQTKL